MVAGDAPIGLRQGNPKMGWATGVCDGGNMVRTPAWKVRPGIAPIRLYWFQRLGNYRAGGQGIAESQNDPSICSGKQRVRGESLGSDAGDRRANTNANHCCSCKQKSDRGTDPAAPLLGQEESLVVCRCWSVADVRLFFNVELEAARRPGNPGYQRPCGQSRGVCSRGGRGDGRFDRGVVSVPSLRPSQTGTLDFHRALRVGDIGRSAKLLPQDGTSEDHSVAIAIGGAAETQPRSIRLTQCDEILQFE